MLIFDFFFNSDKKFQIKKLFRQKFSNKKIFRQKF